MATPNDLRRRVAELVKRAKGDLDALFRQVGAAQSAELREALMDVLPSLVETYGTAAASVAADWYDELRDEAGATGRFTAIPAELPDAGTQSLVGWAAETATDDNAFRSLVAGGMQRRIANGARGTVTRSSVADPQAVGWKRIGGGACAFCRMLIERDELYSEATADFASHDDCNCSAYPLIKGAEPIDVKDYLKSSRYIQDDAKRATEHARVREWMAENL